MKCIPVIFCLVQLISFLLLLVRLAETENMIYLNMYHKINEIIAKLVINKLIFILKYLDYQNLDITIFYFTLWAMSCQVEYYICAFAM